MDVYILYKSWPCQENSSNHPTEVSEQELLQRNTNVNVNKITYGFISTFSCDTFVQSNREE